MVVDAAALVRASSAGLLALLGLAVLAIAWRSPRALALATLLLGFGGANVLVNLAGTDGAVGLVASLLLSVGGVAGAVAACILPRSLRPRERLAIPLGIGAAALTVVLLYLGNPSNTAFAISPGNQGIASTFIAFPAFTAMLVIASARLALDPPPDHAAAIASTALVAVFAPYAVLRLPGINGEPFAIATLCATLLLVVFLSATWLIGAARSGRRALAWGALAWAALGVGSYAYAMAPGNGGAAFFDEWGLLGIARLVGWALMVRAILRSDLLGIPLPHIAVSRGALAAGALAALFIVAQIAQNFFSAEYGLLTGGIVAGAFLFAASPLQRAMERLREPEGRHAAGPSRSASDRGEDSYRKAVRLAMRDRHLAREEERHLHELARDLGIDGVRAHEIMMEVESESERAR